MEDAALVIKLSIAKAATSILFTMKGTLGNGITKQGVKLTH